MAKAKSPRIPLTLWDRFNSKLLPGPPAPIGRPGDCWAWSRAHFKKTGYAMFSIRGRNGKWRPTVAHRIAYELYIAEIPAGLDIDHLCQNRRCVNPWHMEPVTRGENTRRGWVAAGYAAKSRPATQQPRPGPPNWAMTPDWDGRCQRGHLITPETTVVRKNGKHECRSCVRERDNTRNANGGRRDHYAAMKRKRKAASASR
jgi:hypothetical protein